MAQHCCCTASSCKKKFLETLCAFDMFLASLSNKKIGWDQTNWCARRVCLHSSCTHTRTHTHTRTQQVSCASLLMGSNFAYINTCKLAPMYEHNSCSHCMLSMAMLQRSNTICGRCCTAARLPHILSPMWVKPHDCNISCRRACVTHNLWGV